MKCEYFNKTREHVNVSWGSERQTTGTLPDTALLFLFSETEAETETERQRGVDEELATHRPFTREHHTSGRTKHKSRHEPQI